VLEFLMRDSGQPDWRAGEVAGQFEIKGPYLESPIQSSPAAGKPASSWLRCCCTIQSAAAR